MSKRILCLLLLFFLVLIGIAILFFINNKLLSLPTHNFFRPQETQTPVLKNSLSFSPKNQTVIKGQTNTIPVIINTPEQEKKNAPRIIQLEIAYDPLALTAVTVQPGDFFTNPTIVLSLVNQKTGRISYALEASTTNRQKKTGTVAVISFTTTESFSGSETSFSFLPKTMIKMENETTMVTQTTGANLIFVSLKQK